VQNDIINICKSITMILYEVGINNEPLEFYLTSGSRILVVSMLAVARLLSLAGKNVQVKISHENNPTAFTIPINLFSADVGLTNAQIEILRYLKARGRGTFAELAIERSPVTVRKHLTKLRRKGLVDFKIEKRKQVYRLTHLGELLLWMLG